MFKLKKDQIQIKRLFKRKISIEGANYRRSIEKIHQGI